MELTNEFSVNVPIERAWAVLTDVELIAPCLPGAALEEIEGEEYRGGVKIKVGPITAQYKGKARFLEKDDVAHRAVLKAEGRDTKGQGNAAATITAQLNPTATGTDVKVTTDLMITGKVAQFGRGVLADVSAKLLGQFVDCLEHNVLARPEDVAADIAAASATVSSGATHTASAVAAATTSSVSSDATVGSSTGSTTASTVSSAGSAPSAPAAPTVRKINQQSSAAPVDLLGTAGSPVLKRLVPAGVAALVLLWILRRLSSGRSN
jgi:uncharacterized protein